MLPLEPAKKGAGGFANLVASFANEVDRPQALASEKIAQLAAGKVDNVHEVMIALGKAEISFNLMMEIRNKLVEAYKEIMRMQI